MKYGIAPPNYAGWFDRDVAKEVCVLAEDLGYDSLWFGDHVAIPRDIADMFGNAYLDALTTIGFVAGFTERIRLGTNVFVMPYRGPVQTAKQVATLDVLSGGRIDFAVGVGHVEGEFAALGIPFDERGRRTDEYIEVAKLLWSQDCATYEGRWTSFQDLCPLTRPIQNPLPLLVGGDGPRSMARALEHDAGWAPGQGTMDDLERKVLRLRAMADEAGKPCPRVVARWLIHPVEPGQAARAIPHRGELRRPRLDPAAAREELDRIAGLGVDEVIIDIPAHAQTYRKNLTLVMEQIIRR